MITLAAPPSSSQDPKYRFLERHKVLMARPDVMQLAKDIQQRITARDDDALRSLLHGEYPADLADALIFLTDAKQKAVLDLLNPAEAAEMLDELDDEVRRRLVAGLSAQWLASILSELMSDDAADIANDLSVAVREPVLAHLPTDEAANVRRLLNYPRESAGGIMSTGYVAVSEAATQAETVRAFVRETSTEHQFYIYVLNLSGALSGVLDLRQLLSASPDVCIQDIMVRNVLSVPPEMDQEQGANIFSRYDYQRQHRLAVGDHYRPRAVGGQVQLAHWQHAVARQLKTTLILGTATGVTLAAISAIWYGKWTFGVIILIGMFMAVNIAGVVGTVVPLISKRLGFDPALTSGPFETAFQDVVGISIFLALATTLLPAL